MGMYIEKITPVMNTSNAKRQQYVRLAPPEKEAFILRFKVVAGMLSSNNGVLYTNYPVTSE